MDKLRILKDNGERGGVVEIPLAHPATLDLARTSGDSGEGTFAMDGSLFKELVSNFSVRNTPVPVYFGHIAAKDRRNTPAAGFIDKVWVESGKFWGRLDLGPKAWNAVVKERGFRSFSVEIELDYAAPTGTVKGWSLGGGAITNTPAIPFQYVAASAGDGVVPHVTLTTQVQLTNGDDNMSAELERQKVELEVKLSTVNTQVKELTDKLEGMSKVHAEAITALQAENDKLRNEGIASVVKATIEKALTDGKVIAAEVTGYDKDPVLWLSESPYKDAAALAVAFEKRPVVVNMNKKVSSGSDQKPATDEDDATTLRKKVAAEMAKNSTDFKTAMLAVRAADPELYERATATYRGEA